jgi:hypothetical protein
MEPEFSRRTFEEKKRSISNFIKIRPVGAELIDRFTLKMKPLWSFEASATNYPVTQCHIPEDLNPQQHLCEKQKSLSALLSVTATPPPAGVLFALSN